MMRFPTKQFLRSSQQADSVGQPNRSPTIHDSNMIMQMQKRLGNRATLQFLQSQLQPTGSAVVQGKFEDDAGT